jgi:hypothetical protein
VASQVGFVLIFFGVQSVGLGIQFPVDVLGAFPGIVDFMFGELGRKSMKWTFMDATDEPFHNLVGQKLQVLEKLCFM